MPLSPARFNAFLNTIGQTVSWRAAHDCPCRAAYSGAARTDCAICHGKGVFWDAPIEGVAGFSSANLQRKFSGFGEFLPGDVVITLPSDSDIYRMGVNDRVILYDSQERFSMSLIRSTADRVAFNVITLDRVFWLDGNQALVEGAVPDSEADGLLSFVEPAPAVGTQYTLEGWRSPEFFVFIDLVKDRPYHQGAALPRRVLARRFDLWGR